jgi:hypothetical protein
LGLFISTSEKMNYEQSGGHLETLALENMTADFIKINHARIGYLEIYGDIDQLHITQSKIDRFSPGLKINRLGLENTQFNVAFLDLLESDQVFFSHCAVNEELITSESKINTLLLIDSQVAKLDYFGGTQINQLDFIRTPIKTIEMQEGHIKKLSLKQIDLPSQWMIQDKAQIDLLEIKQALFPSTFKYQGKAFPLCSVALGNNEQLYKKIDGGRLPEILKKQIAREATAPQKIS